MPSWEEAVRREVAVFRMDAARAADRSEFDVVETPSLLKVLVLPELGPIEFENVTLTYSEPDGRELRVSFYAPHPGPYLERTRALFLQRART
ncbi:hypothetical protein [Corallococcus sp. AB049A]|nr:hypothetical protein [Corallococcus sp. AB049A]